MKGSAAGRSGGHWPGLPWRWPGNANISGSPRQGQGGSPKKTRNPLPNPTSRVSAGPSRPLEAPGGPWTSRGPKVPEGLSVAGPLFMKEEWEFRASARNPKRNKVGGCLRKQGVGKRNQRTKSWFVWHERCAVA